MTMLALPGIVYNVGMELREKLVHAIIGQNGSLLAYWSAVYLFHYAVYSAFTTAFVIFQYLFGSDRYYKLQFWPAFCNINCMGICSNWFWYLFVNDFKKISFADAICVYHHVIING